MSPFLPNPQKNSPTNPQEAEMLVRQKIVGKAKEYLGLEYTFGGDEPETGVDCSGFTALVMDAFSIPLARHSGEQAEAGREIPLDLVQAGDLIFFKRSRRKPISHVAIVVENKEEGVVIIHAVDRGVVIDTLNESRFWRTKVVAARDIITDHLPELLPKPAPPEPTPVEKLFLPTLRPAAPESVGSLIAARRSRMIHREEVYERALALPGRE